MMPLKPVSYTHLKMKKNRIVVLTACTALMVSVSGCQSQKASVAESQSIAAESTATMAEEPESLAVVTVEEEAVPLYSKPAGSNVRTPQASGTTTYSNNSVTLDASNLSQGLSLIHIFA